MTLIIVAATPVNVFAVYVIGQSLVQLVFALADGGMAASVQIIAAKEKPTPAFGCGTTGDRAIRRRLRRSLDPRHYSIVEYLSSSWAHKVRFKSPPPSSSCVRSPVLCKRASTCARTIIYSAGQFRTYSIAQLVTPLTRITLVAGDLLAHTHLTTSLLVLNDQSRIPSAGFTAPRRLTPDFGLATPPVMLEIFRRWRLITATCSGPDSHRHFWPALGGQVVVLSGGVFASGPRSELTVYSSGGRRSSIRCSTR